MKDITNSFGSLYHPQKAFLVYGHNDGNNVYVESYDIADNGCPINAHPLSIKEAEALAKALSTKAEKKAHFLKPDGLLPRNLLYLDNGKNAYAIWHTPKQSVKLLFKEELSTHAVWLISPHWFGKRTGTAWPFMRSFQRVK